MRILFYGDECGDFWELLPVMSLMGPQREIAYGSVDKRALALAEKHNLSIAPSLDDYDMLVVNKMHYFYARALSELYCQKGKPIVLVEHSTDGRVHLADSFMGQPINFFSVMAVNGQREFNLLKNKFPGKLRITGIPKLDKLSEAPHWDKREIYGLVKTDSFVLVTIPQQNEYPIEVQEKYFNELPKLLPCKPVYKIHPRYPVEPYLKYNQIILEDDTLTKDITYELINASQGIATPSSFMIVEASILKKPVILFCHEDWISFDQLAPELEILRTIPPEYDPAKLSSSFDNPKFNNHQLELIKNYLHDGKNTERVANLINEILDRERKTKMRQTIQKRREKRKKEKARRRGGKRK